MEAPMGRPRRLSRAALALLAIAALGGLGGCISIPQRALQNGAALDRLTGRYDAGVIGNGSIQAQRLRQQYLNASAFDHAMPRPYSCFGKC